MPRSQCGPIVQPPPDGARRVCTATVVPCTSRSTSRFRRAGRATRNRRCASSAFEVSDIGQVRIRTVYRGVQEVEAGIRIEPRQVVRRRSHRGRRIHGNGGGAVPASRATCRMGSTRRLPLSSPPPRSTRTVRGAMPPTQAVSSSSIHSFRFDGSQSADVSTVQPESDLKVKRHGRLLLGRLERLNLSG